MKNIIAAGCLCAGSTLISTAQQGVERNTFYATGFNTESQSGVDFSLLEFSESISKGNNELGESLLYLPSTVFSQAGQKGRSGTVYVRGGEATHVQLLLDGFRVSDSNVTPANLMGMLMPSSNDQVVIVRSNSGALHGSNSGGGLIALDGKGLIGDSFTSQTLGMDYGTFDTKLGRLGFKKIGARVGLSVDLSAYETQNSSSLNDNERVNYNLKSDIVLNENNLLSFVLRGGYNFYENNSFKGGGEEKYRYSLSGVIWDFGNEKYTSSTRLGYFEDSHDTLAYFYGSSSSRESDRWMLQHHGEYLLNDEIALAYGMEAISTKYVDYANSTPWVDSEEMNKAIYIGGLFSPSDQVSLLSNIRYDRHDSYGDEISYRLSGSYQFLDNLSAKASYGTGFRSPRYIELYGVEPSIPYPYEGNPHLRSETAKSYTAGLEWRNDNFKIEGIWFQTQIDDIILNGFFDGSKTTSINFKDAKARGIETAMSYRMNNSASAFMNYTYTDTSDSDGGRSPRIPRHQVSLGIDYQAEKWAAGVQAVAYFDRATEYFGTADDFVLARVYGNYKVNENLSVHASIDNVTNTDYQKIPGFKGLPLTVNGGITLEF